MEIDRTITNIWTIVVEEKDVLDRMIDETIQEGDRRTAGNAPSLLASDDNKAILHRYYCSALAELSAVLAKRTRKYGGGIGNETDPDTKMIKTTFFMPMTDNHEAALVEPLGADCLEFLVARLMEQWYGHGSDFGGNMRKDQIRGVLNYRRWPIERPNRPL